MYILSKEYYKALHKFNSVFAYVCICNIQFIKLQHRRVATFLGKAAHSVDRTYLL